MCVADFYHGKRVLLTGSTGFLGKVLLERLLWEELAQPPLHLLMRGDPEARLRELASSPAFARLQQRHAPDVPSFVDWLMSRVRCFSCDLEAEDLGMGPQERQAAFGGVDIVMHCAARVSWDERLDVAIRANTLGTRSLFQACADEADSRSPPVFVHISSTFVHGMAPAPHAETALPPSSVRARIEGSSAPEFDIEGLIAEALAEGARVDAEFAAAAESGRFGGEARMRLPPGASEADVRALERRIAERRARSQLSQHGIQVARRHGWWDPYTLSKGMAEICLEAESKARGMPLVVVRPSGIISCAQEPSPGWIDCYLLNEPIIEATGRGQLTAFPGREDSVLDMVPADFVVNLIIAAATQPQKPEVGPAVYQAASGDVNPVHQGDLARWWFEYFRECPFRSKDGLPVAPVQPKLIGSLDSFLARMRWRAGAPVAVASAVVGSLPGSSPWLRRLRERVGKMQGAVDNAMRLASLYSVYTIERFEFKSDKARKLLEGLAEEDQRRFNPATCEDIDWKAYFRELHIPGMRKHVLKEAGLEPMALEQTRALARRQVPVSRL